MIHKEIHEILGFGIPFSARLYLLNDFKLLALDEGSIYVKRLIGHLLTAARVLLAKYWQSLVIPTKEEYCSKIRFVLVVDKLSAIINVRNTLVEAMEKIKRPWGKLLMDS